MFPQYTVCLKIDLDDYFRRSPGRSTVKKCTSSYQSRLVSNWRSLKAIISLVIPSSWLASSRCLAMWALNPAMSSPIEDDSSSCTSPWVTLGSVNIRSSLEWTPWYQFYAGRRKSCFRGPCCNRRGFNGAARANDIDDTSSWPIISSSCQEETFVSCVLAELAIVESTLSERWCRQTVPSWLAWRDTVKFVRGFLI